MSLTLLVATASFPFGQATHFMEQIASLAGRFDRIVLPPAAREGPPVDLPADDTADLRVADQVETRARRILLALRSRRSLSLLRETTRGTRPPANARSWVHLLSAVGTAERVHQWADAFGPDRPALALTVWAGPSRSVSLRPAFLP